MAKMTPKMKRIVLMNENKLLWIYIFYIFQIRYMCAVWAAISCRLQVSFIHTLHVNDTFGPRVQHLVYMMEDSNFIQVTLEAHKSKQTSSHVSLFSSNIWKQKLLFLLNPDRYWDRRVHLQVKRTQKMNGQTSDHLHFSTKKKKKESSTADENDPIIASRGSSKFSASICNSAATCCHRENPPAGRLLTLLDKA